MFLWNECPCRCRSSLVVGSRAAVFGLAVPAADRDGRGSLPATGARHHAGVLNRVGAVRDRAPRERIAPRQCPAFFTRLRDLLCEAGGPVLLHFALDAGGVAAGGV